MIIGVGVDLVDVNRFENKLATTSGLLEKIFHPDERAARPRTLAGVFAAKEALVKAFGGSTGMHWHEVVVSKTELGAPFFELTGESSTTARNKGVTNLQLSISHDGDYAMAFVIAEGN